MPPRIAPLPTSKFTDAQARVFGGDHGDPMNEMNLIRTMVQHLDLYKRFIPFAGGLVMQTTLPPRHREILTVRTLELTGEKYEAIAHVRMAKDSGLTDAEAKAAREGEKDLPPFEMALCQAAEDLVKRYRISDSTWAILAAQYTTEQLIEVHFTVGNYVLMSMLTIGLGIEPDPADIAWKPK